MARSFLCYIHKPGVLTPELCPLSAGQRIMVGAWGNSPFIRQCTCIQTRRGQCLCKLSVRASLPGATICALVLGAPALDLCPGRLATTDAQ